MARRAGKWASAEHAAYFDIDWTPVVSTMRDKLLLPILGDQYGCELERGHLQLAFDSGALRCGISTACSRSIRDRPRLCTGTTWTRCAWRWATTTRIYGSS